MAKRLTDTDQFKSECRSFSTGFIVGFLAAKGFADIQDEEAQPGVTKAKEEAIEAMGTGHAKYLEEADRKIAENLPDALEEAGWDPTKTH